MNEVSEPREAGDRPDDARPARPAPRRRWAPLLLLLVAACLYAVDQLTKNWVVDSLPEGRTVPVVEGFLEWHFVRNPGAAFSMAEGATWVFTILATVVTAVILWQIRRLGSLWWAVFLGLLLGGVLGNLTDRLTRAPGFPTGHVIDFISTPWMIPAFYNVADMAIVTGMALFVLITLLGLTIDGAPRAKRGRGDKAEESERTAESGTAPDSAASGSAASDPQPAASDSEPGAPAPGAAASPKPRQGSSEGVE